MAQLRADDVRRLEQGAAQVQVLGRIALAGIPSEERSSFPAAVARRKGVTIAMVRRMNDTYPRAIAMATAGIDLDLLVTERHPLAEAAKAFRSAAERRGDKVVVSVSSS